MLVTKYGPWHKRKKCHCGKWIRDLYFDGLCPQCGCADRIETIVCRFVWEESDWSFSWSSEKNERLEEWSGCTCDHPSVG
jgi:hypothetical protein